MIIKVNNLSCEEILQIITIKLIPTLSPKHFFSYFSCETVFFVESDEITDFSWTSLQ